MDDSGADSLGTTLRRWRDRLSPADAGLRPRPGRRASGLRREELADLAGLSVDYVVRLEQGRAAHPSAQVVAALARALQLHAVERDHLFRLAGLLPPAAGRIEEHLPASLARIVARLGELPMATFSADWHMVSWTPSWAALIGDPAQVAPELRNLVRATFPVAGDASKLAWWPVNHDQQGHDLESALVADLRQAAASRPGDPRLAELIGSRRRGNARFAALWDAGAVGLHLASRKTVEHPVVGPVALDCDVLTAPGSDIKLVVLSAAAGTPDADRLDFLRVTGALQEPVQDPLPAPRTPA